MTFVQRFAAVLAALTTLSAAAAAGPDPERPSAGRVDEILRGLELRYDAQGFSADFHQESTLAALEVTDEASGKLWIRKPAMMRWEYEAPELQTIVTDGRTLWIYRPQDRQVMRGPAPRYFRDGKGASFLTDVAGLRRNFQVLPGPGGGSGFSLVLVPLQETGDVARIEVTVDPDTYKVTEIVTVNSYGDRTRIRLSGYDFEDHPDDGFFRFQIPEGTDVMELEP